MLHNSVFDITFCMKTKELPNNTVTGPQHKHMGNL